MNEGDVPQERPRTSEAPASEAPLCKVQGCSRDMSLEKTYYKRYSVCAEHLRSLELLVDGRKQRFCQQCGKFQDIKEFDETKRSCRKQLALHSQRRRFKLSQQRLQHQQEQQGLAGAGEAGGEQAHLVASSARKRQPTDESPLDPLQPPQQRLQFDAKGHNAFELLSWVAAMSKEQDLNLGVALGLGRQDAGGGQVAGGRQERRRTGKRPRTAATGALSSGSPDRRPGAPKAGGLAGGFCLDLEKRPEPEAQGSRQQLHPGLGLLENPQEGRSDSLVSIARSGSSGAHAGAGAPAVILVSAEGGKAAVGPVSRTAPPVRLEWPNDMPAATLSSGSQQQQQPQPQHSQGVRGPGANEGAAIPDAAMDDALGGAFASSGVRCAAAVPVGLPGRRTRATTSQATALPAPLPTGLELASGVVKPGLPLTATRSQQLQPGGGQHLDAAALLLLSTQMLVQDIQLESELTAMLDELTANKQSVRELEQLRNLASAGSGGSSVEPPVAMLSGSLPWAVGTASAAGGGSGPSSGSDASATLGPGAGGTSFGAGAGVGSGAWMPSARAAASGTRMPPLPPPPPRLPSRIPSPIAQSPRCGGDGGSCSAPTTLFKSEVYGNDDVAFSAGTGAAAVGAVRHTALDGDTAPLLRTPAVHDSHFHIPSTAVSEMDGFGEQQREHASGARRLLDMARSEAKAQSAAAAEASITERDWVPIPRWQASIAQGPRPARVPVGGGGGAGGGGGSCGEGFADFLTTLGGTSSGVPPWHVVSPFVQPQEQEPPPSQQQQQQQERYPTRGQYFQQHGQPRSPPQAAEQLHMQQQELQRPRGAAQHATAHHPGDASGSWQAAPFPSVLAGSLPEVGVVTLQPVSQQFYQMPPQPQHNQQQHPLRSQQSRQDFTAQDQQRHAPTSAGMEAFDATVRRSQASQQHHEEHTEVMMPQLPQPPQPPGPYQQALSDPTRTAAFNTQSGECVRGIDPIPRAAHPPEPPPAMSSLQDFTPYLSGQLLQRLSLKLYGCSPEDLMPDSRVRLQSWLASMNLQMLQLTVRSGCAHLIAEVLVPVGALGPTADPQASVGLTGRMGAARVPTGHATQKPGSALGAATPVVYDTVRHHHWPTEAMTATAAAPAQVSEVDSATPTRPVQYIGSPDDDSCTPASTLLRPPADTTEEEEYSGATKRSISNSNCGSQGCSQGSSHGGSPAAAAPLEHVGVRAAERPERGGSGELTEIQLLLSRLCGGGAVGAEGGGDGGKCSSSLQMLLEQLLGPLYGRTENGSMEAAGDRLLLQVDQQVVRLQWLRHQVSHDGRHPNDMAMNLLQPGQESQQHPGMAVPSTEWDVVPSYSTPAPATPLKLLALLPPAVVAGQPSQVQVTVRQSRTPLGAPPSTSPQLSAAAEEPPRLIHLRHDGGCVWTRNLDSLMPLAPHEYHPVPLQAAAVAVEPQSDPADTASQLPGGLAKLVPAAAPDATETTDTASQPMAPLPPSSASAISAAPAATVAVPPRSTVLADAYTGTTLRAANALAAQTDGKPAGGVDADTASEVVLSLDVPALAAPGLAFVESSCGEVLGPWLLLLVVPSEAVAAELEELVLRYGTATNVEMRPPLEPFLVDMGRLMLLDSAGACLEEAGYTEDWESYLSYCEIREAMPDALVAASRLLRKCIEWHLPECTNLATGLLLDLLREPS